MKKYNVVVNGNTYEVEVEEVTGAVSAAPAAVQAPVAAAPVAAAAPAAPKATAPAASAGTAGSTPVTAPMPGTILDVKVNVGDTVKKGQTLFILEAMKMENEIPSPADGVISSVDTTKGSSVASGAVLATLK